MAISFSGSQHAPMWGHGMQHLSLQGCSLPSKSNMLSLLAGGESLLTCAGPQHGPQSQWSSRSAQSTCTARPCFDAAGPAPCASASPWGRSSGSSWRQVAGRLRVLPRSRQVCCCLEPGPSRRVQEDCAASGSSRGRTGCNVNRQRLQSCGVGRWRGRGASLSAASPEQCGAVFCRQPIP